MRVEDPTGKTFGRLTVVRLEGRNQFDQRTALCKCACGKETTPSIYALRSGAIKSCGCLRDEANKNRKGHNKNWKSYRPPSHPHRRTWSSWCSMRSRCFNLNSPASLKYGRAGITVCEHWKDSFLNFVEDLGERPDGMTLDRINSKGHYSCGKCPECLKNNWPSNCKWSTGSEQCFNRSISRPITINGETKFLRQWCRQFGISHTTVNQRERYGWNIVTALTTPVTKRIAA